MVYIFLADGFEEIEALCVLDFLRRAGVETKTVGIDAKIIVRYWKQTIDNKTPPYIYIDGTVDQTSEYFVFKPNPKSNPLPKINVILHSFEIFLGSIICITLPLISNYPFILNINQVLVQFFSFFPQSF